MDQEECQSADWKVEEEEEKQQHETPSYLVEHRCGVEESALWEKVEGKLLNISFEYNQKEDSIEGILSKWLRNTIVEKQSECKREDDVD